MSFLLYYFPQGKLFLIKSWVMLTYMAQRVVLPCRDYKENININEVAVFLVMWFPEAFIYLSSVFKEILLILDMENIMGLSVLFDWVSYLLELFLCQVIILVYIVYRNNLLFFSSYS